MLESPSVLESIRRWDADIKVHLVVDAPLSDVDAYMAGKCRESGILVISMGLGQDFKIYMVDDYIDIYCPYTVHSGRISGLPYAMTRSRGWLRKPDGTLIRPMVELKNSDSTSGPWSKMD